MTPGQEPCEAKDVPVIITGLEQQPEKQCRLNPKTNKVSSQMPFTCSRQEERHVRFQPKPLLAVFQEKG